MRAIQLTEPRRLRIIELPEPAQPGEGEALVRVHAVGICGTDYGGYLGKMAFFSYPRIPGHELGVEVVAIGAGVTNVKSGDRGCVEPYINCQRCYSCRRGHTNCCENHQTLGVHCDGGLRPFFAVPARKLHISRQLAADQLALVETLAIGCHAVNRAALRPGENVLVLGAGPIGLSVIEFARVAGARVTVLDLNEQRLAFVREQLKVPDTIVAGPEALKRLGDLTNGQLADVVIDATGHHESMSRCFEFAAFAGRVVYVGITVKDLVFPHAPILHRRELTLLASRNALSADFPHIISLIEQGRIDTGPWLTHRADLADVPAIFPTWLNPDSGVIKAVVRVPAK
jgi:2-desacetyl-2-hydroxyethyl bacteriochlorophyllide A dehydrogenase